MKKMFNDNIENAQIQYNASLGDYAWEHLIDYMREFEEEDANADLTAMMFSIFVYSIQHLHNAGWTEEQLIQEVWDHCATARGEFIINHDEFGNIIDDEAAE